MLILKRNKFNVMIFIIIVFNDIAYFFFYFLLHLFLLILFFLLKIANCYISAYKLNSTIKI